MIAFTVKRERDVGEVEKVENVKNTTSKTSQSRFLGALRSPISDAKVPKYKRGRVGTLHPNSLLIKRSFFRQH